MQQQHVPPIYDSIAAKLQSSALSPPNIGGGGSSNQFMTNHINPLLQAAVSNNRPVEYATIDRKTVDYRHMNANPLPPPGHSLTLNHVEMRHHRNGMANDEHRLSSGSDLMANGGPGYNNLLNNSSMMNQLHGMNGPPPPVMPRGNAALISNISSKDNNRNLNSRNHIITDTLPGPESCV